MKRALYIFALAAVMISCNHQSVEATKQEVQTAKEFLEDLSSIKNLDEPIRAYLKGAEKTANFKNKFTKSNAEEMLSKAREYSDAVIVVEDHTVVKVTNLADCQESLSWGACMPMGEGFIKKNGKLIEQKDYINNIIGLPDNSKRTIFFFNQNE